jgi:hypothetical protein
LPAAPLMAGMSGETMYNYGIQNEESDLRVHVSVCNSTAYIFTPEAAMSAIRAHPEVEQKNAWQPGVNFATAKGYPMPTKYIPGIKAVKIPADIFDKCKFSKNDTTSEKGNKAVFCITEMLKLGMIPIAFSVDEVADRTMQIQGTDILVKANYRIQVKCDWRIGETGNIYLQTQETNPLKRI